MIDFDMDLALGLLTMEMVRRIEVYFAKNFPNQGRPLVEVDELESWIRLKVGGAAIGFIAIRDGATKTLGTFQRGDILYGASYKSPAKHTRGNLFSRNGGTEALTACGQHIRTMR